MDRQSFPLMAPEKSLCAKTEYEEMIAGILPNVCTKLCEQLQGLHDVFALDCLNRDNSGLYFSKEDQLLTLSLGSFQLEMDCDETIISRHRLNPCDAVFSGEPKLFHWTDSEIRLLRDQIVAELNP